MRVLLLLRGSAGCGKSTWIEQNGLKPYTLCADDIRLLCSSPVLNVAGKEEISQANDAVVWSTLFRLLETRMQNGEFTVIDATNSKTTEMNRYKELCNSYKYRIFCVDFTSIPIEVTKERNRNRLPEMKRVPEFVIDKMYSRFQTQKIPSGITVIQPDELDRIWMKPIDLSEYKRIHHIGDIHGCYTALKEYIINSYFDINNSVYNKNVQWDYTVDKYWEDNRWLSIEDFSNETWKDIREYEGLYQVSNYGRVKSLVKRAGKSIRVEKILKPAIVATYLQVVLSKDGIHRNYKIHRLVADAFIENNRGLPQVNHIDTNRSNNNVENLEWSSCKDNIQHSVKLQNYHNMIVGQYDIDGNFIKAYISIEEASRQTGIDNRCISKVCRKEDKYLSAGGYVWKYADDMPLYDFIKNDNMYIFTGDYVDRGIENAEVVNFLTSIYNRNNVLLLEGNHERWLWIWANEGVCKSKEFEINTKYQLNSAGVSKKDIRQLYRKLGQCAYYKYGDNMYLVTHAGLSTVPANLTYVATDQMIKGVGNYNDVEAVAESFVANTPENVYQIHGHRNTKSLPVQANDRVFNLEGKVEFGGALRCVQLLQDGTHECVEVQNTVFKELELPKENTEASEMSVGDAIIALRQNRFVQEKPYGAISSFNFTKQAFYDKVWDEQTTKARGLYINIPKQKVVARAYEKFFNINERPETKLESLSHRLEFPVTAYVKENGFLGIASYNEEDDSLFVTTKSSPDGDFAGWLRDIIDRKMSAEAIEKMKTFSKENNVSFVFECVDMKNDPHIIEYDEDELFLLDIVYNDLEFKKFEYTQMAEVAISLGLKYKTLSYVIESWSDFFDWYYQVTDEDYECEGRKIEGFVIEDANGYMVKLKLHYYNFWKFMRSISHEAIRHGYINPRRTSALTSALANKYYGWVKTLHDTDDLDSVSRDICTLRKMFYESDEGKAFIKE